MGWHAEPLAPAVINDELYAVMMKLSSKSVVCYKPNSFKEHLLPGVAGRGEVRVQAAAAAIMLAILIPAEPAVAVRHRVAPAGGRGIILMMVPLIVFFSLQRFFVRGLLAGGVK